MEFETFREVWRLTTQEDPNRVFEAIAKLETVEEVDLAMRAEMATHGRFAVQRHCLRRLQELRK